MPEPETVVAWLTRARRRGCPLLAISSPDPEGVVARVQQALSCAKVWDCSQGWRTGGEGARTPEELVLAVLDLPGGSLVLALWQPEFWADPATRQALQGVRDPAKGDGRTLVLVGRDLRLPAALQEDFVLCAEPLPGPQELDTLLAQVEEAGRAAVGEMPTLQGQARDQAVAALQGLSLFQAEQQAFLAMGEQGVQVPGLWQAKVQYINSTPGLACWQGGETFAQVAGLAGIKAYLRRVIAGRLPVRLVMWLDEIEKALAGAQGDLSGISQDYLGTLLSHLQDTEAQACLLFGHPGLGKSLIAKATGTEAGCLTVRFDPGACKGSLVGESEARLRQVLAMERAIVGHRPAATLWLVTCNSVGGLPQELRSRFQAEWFYDYPTWEGTLALWTLYTDKYGLGQAVPDELPATEGWSGREIERCCRLAWQFGVPLTEASRYIVPAAVAGREQIEQRRKEAIGRYLDAETGEVYQGPEAVGKRPLRAMERRQN